MEPATYRLEWDLAEAPLELLRAELRAAPGGFAEGAVPAGLEGILIPETAPEARTADVLERVEELVNRLRGGGDAGHAAAITLVGFMVREGGRGERRMHTREGLGEGLAAAGH